jgi:hypothetical protein
LIFRHLKHLSYVWKRHPPWLFQALPTSPVL